MSIVVQPKTVITLSELLRTASLTLLVRETGASKWEVSFDPEVLEGSGIVLTPVIILGESPLKAIQDTCEFLSGREGLRLADLDLYYTKVECDYEGAPKADPEPEPDISLLKGLRRHHGGE